MPPKIRELVGELDERASSTEAAKAVTETSFTPKVAKPITISGALGDDAKHYQVRAVKRAVEESKS